MMRFDCRGLSTEDLAKSEQVQQAYNCLVKNGYAILDHVLPEDKVRDMNLEFNRRYTKYLQNQELEDTRKVGNRRFMVPIDLSGAFGDPLVYAHPFVVAVVRKALALLAQGALGQGRLLLIGASVPSRQMRLLREQYAPGASSGEEPIVHAEGEECGLVTRGTVELTVDGQVSVLNAGDGYYFPTTLPHRFRNIGADEAEIISANTPANF